VSLSANTDCEDDGFFVGDLNTFMTCAGLFASKSLLVYYVRLICTQHTHTVRALVIMLSDIARPQLVQVRAIQLHWP